jgi:MFS family permease
MQFARRQDDTQWGKGSRSKWAAKISLLLSGDDGMVQTALIISLLASISAAFPEADIWLVDQVMSVTAMMMIPAMLATSKLAQYFNKKHIIIFGTVIFMLAGLAASLAPNIYILIATRAVLGIGAGLSFPLVPSAIAYLFREREKNQMLGWMNACGGILSFTLGIGSGIIAEYSWRASFILYLIFVPVIILQVVCLPNFMPERKDALQRAKSEAITIVKEHINWKMWLVGLCMVSFMCVMMTVIFKLSIFVESNGFGTPAASGMASSMNTAAAFAISLIFSSYLKLTRRFAVPVSLLCAASCFALMALAQNMQMIYASTICMGLCMGTINPYLFATMSNVAPYTKKTIGMTMVCIAQLAGQVFTPYYMMLVNALGFVDEIALFWFTSALFTVAAIVVAITFALRLPQKGTLPSPNDD